MALQDELVAQLAGPGGGRPQSAGPSSNSGAAAQAGIQQKVHYVDASYTPNGPAPFICANCQYSNPGQGQHLACEIVSGPYKGGTVGMADSCRLFEAQPIHAALAPIDDASWAAWGEQAMGDQANGADQQPTTGEPKEPDHAEPDGDEGPDGQEPPGPEEETPPK